MNLNLKPCSPTLKRGRFWLLRPRADLSRSATGLVYMPRARTPVVSNASRCTLSVRNSGAAPAGTRVAFDAAFASRYWLGHHGNNCLSGLDPFTLLALRPAHSLSTLRPTPRGARRKTRYYDLSVFPLTRLRPGSSPDRHPLVSCNFVTHIAGTYFNAIVESQFFLRAASAVIRGRSDECWSIRHSNWQNEVPARSGRLAKESIESAHPLSPKTDEARRRLLAPHLHQPHARPPRAPRQRLAGRPLAHCLNHQLV